MGFLCIIFWTYLVPQRTLFLDSLSGPFISSSVLQTVVSWGIFLGKCWDGAGSFGDLFVPCFLPRLDSPAKKQGTPAVRLMTSQGLGFTLTKGRRGSPWSETSSLTIMRPKGLLRFRSRFARLGSEPYIKLASMKEVRALICSLARD